MTSSKIIKNRFVRRWVRLTKKAKIIAEIGIEGFPINYLVIQKKDYIGKVIRVIQRRENMYLVDLRLTTEKLAYYAYSGSSYMQYYLSDVEDKSWENVSVWWRRMKKKFKEHKKSQGRTRMLRKKHKIGRKYQEKW